MSSELNVLYGGDSESLKELENKSFGEIFLQRLKDLGDLVVLVDVLTSVEISCNELRHKIIDFAQCLSAAGLKKGDTIGIVSDNRIEFPLPLLGALLLGITVAPMNVTYTERELQHAFNLSHPRVVFTAPQAVKSVTNAAKKTNFVLQVVLFGNELLDESVILFDEFFKKYRQPYNENFKPTPVDNNNDVAIILCSSGTTGLPKGVEITYYNLLVSIDGFNLSQQTIRRDEKNTRPIVVGIIPWFHTYGCITLIAASYTGMKMPFLPKFEETLFLSTIERYKVNTLFMVPPLIVLLAKSALVKNFNISTVTEIFSGAAPLGQDVIDLALVRLNPKCLIRQGYGLSEATLGVTNQKPDLMKPGSVGTLASGTYAKVIDTETGKTLGANQQGELLFKGGQIMKGYVGDSEATQNAIDKDGWLHTGDVGYYDNDGHFYIVDRLKELIKYKAYQVPPAELEAILLFNVNIKDAAVVGLADEDCGELPLAFVVKQPDAKITESDIVKYVAERVSSAKRLRGGVKFIDEIPKNPSGKILRRELRALLKTPKSKL